MTKISFKKAQELAAQKEWQLYRCADYYQQEEVEGKYNRYRYYKSGYLVFDGEQCCRWQILQDFALNCLENDRPINGFLTR